jgi:hypothetical protein
MDTDYEQELVGVMTVKEKWREVDVDSMLTQQVVSLMSKMSLEDKVKLKVAARKLVTLP